MTRREASPVASCSNLGIAAIAVTLFSIGPLPAGAPPEKIEGLCNFKSPASGCPGPSCRCVEGTLEITLDGDSQSVFEYETFQEGLQIEASVVSEAASAKIHGWSFGVAHDPEALELVEVPDSPFCEFSLFFEGCSSVAGQSWESSPECSPRPVSEGFGWVSFVLLRPGKLKELPSGRSVLGRAVYRLRKDVGEEGTLIHFSECLGAEGSVSPSGLFASVGDEQMLWSAGVDGWVKKRGTATPFLRGDLDGNGKINVLDGLLHVQIQSGNMPSPYDCADALDANDDGKIDRSDTVAILRFVFERWPEIPAPFPACEPDPTPDGLRCPESNCARP
jgi:hypothetical protein